MLINGSNEGIANQRKRLEGEASMASQPGPLTHWPWQRLGNYKYVSLAPFVVHSMYKLITNKEEERDMSNVAILPVLVLRLLHTQLWISFARCQTAQSKRCIVKKSLDFDQVDRERNWDDQIILTALLTYMANIVLPGARHLPWWNAKGVAITTLLHMGPVEFIYYWLHRALHHHFLYARYHSHHHASIVTEPVTSVIHPFVEEVLYFILFATPLLTLVITQTGSITAVAGYLLYIDFMNYLGHCNFELVPKCLFDAFPPLKYLMYTPSFHSLHHTHFRTNYSLFMPLYDYIYGTVDDSTDDLYEKSLKRKQEPAPDVIHLTHLTTLQSVCHLRLGFPSLASKPYVSKWFMWPFTCVSIALTWFYGSTFTVERNWLKKLEMETWVVPRYNFQYMSPLEKDSINDLIEKAILKAEHIGAKAISLGLLNQGNELNGYGGHYLRKNPKLKVRIVDGTSLAVAAVLNKLPQGTRQVLLRGNLSKMGCVLASVLCQREVQVVVARRYEYEFLKLKLPQEMHSNLVFSNSYRTEVWLVGEGLKDEEQTKGEKGVRFIPFSQFPPKILRNDCFYYSTPALMVPEAYENLHTCENWLPRRVMSAWRTAGIIHVLEGWGSHECGDVVSDIDKVWQAALHHGFHPFNDHHSISHTRSQ